MNAKFNVTGQDRKRLVGAISQLTNQPTHYEGAPGFGYQVGDYRIDKTGAVIGPDSLRRMVAAKAPLIKMALGVDELPNEVLDDRQAFDWFAADNDSGQIDCWALFIAALCKTAMAKKRVTAQKREFTNPRYQMRCFCLALGMIGQDYAATRRLLIANCPTAPICSQFRRYSSWPCGWKCTNWPPFFLSEPRFTATLSSQAKGNYNPRPGNAPLRGLLLVQKV
jgi:hypothetical protein